MQKKFIKIEEAAEYTGYSKSTLYTLIQKGEIPCYKPGGRLLLTYADLDAWIAKGRREDNETVEQRAVTHCAVNPI